MIFFSFLGGNNIHWSCLAEFVLIEEFSAPILQNCSKFGDGIHRQKLLLAFHHQSHTSSDNHPTSVRKEVVKQSTASLKGGELAHEFEGENKSISTSLPSFKLHM